MTDSHAAVLTISSFHQALYYLCFIFTRARLAFRARKLLQVWRENMMMAPSGVASCVQPGIFQGRYRDVTEPGCQRLLDVYIPPTSGKISGTRPGRETRQGLLGGCIKWHKAARRVPLYLLRTKTNKVNDLDPQTNHVSSIMNFEVVCQVLARRLVIMSLISPMAQPP